MQVEELWLASSLVVLPSPPKISVAMSGWRAAAALSARWSFELVPVHATSGRVDGASVDAAGFILVPGRRLLAFDVHGKTFTARLGWTGQGRGKGKGEEERNCWGGERYQSNLAR
jgi:hypothetical protein